EYTLVSSSPADWSGNYVITYGTSASNMYALKGLSGNVKYESSSSGSAVLLSNSGMSYANSKLSGATAPYIFKIAANGSKYTIRSSSTGSYVASYSSYLYSRTNLETNYCLWSLSCSNGNMTATNSASSSYPNLSFASSKYFMLSSSAPSSLRFWKQGGGSTTYYTTSPSAASPDPEPVTTYTVSFSVPSGVSSVASQTAAADSYITLPTAGAPSGYTFLGWVTSAVSSTTTKPTVLTGSYKVTDNITLRALYSYTTSSGSAYQLLGSAPADWNGKYVITYGTNTGSMYVLKGLSGNASYESSTSGGAVLLSNTGMSYANGALSGATDAYIFNVAANGSYYTIQNSATGSYLANYNSYLYSRSSYESAYSRWTLSCSNQNMTVKNAASSNYPYLSFYNGTKYFMMNSSVPTGLYFWKQSAAGTGTTYYTTG
ncbi:MAG: InlB B-repeat-containing protein, partial [Oscillospiraceae bacterium]|nr:InlB B-repeat-containing protein [Oscillospiraceae bacterium]